MYKATYSTLGVQADKVRQAVQQLRAAQVQVQVRVQQRHAPTGRLCTMLDVYCTGVGAAVDRLQQHVQDIADAADLRVYNSFYRCKASSVPAQVRTRYSAGKTRVQVLRQLQRINRLYTHIAAMCSTDAGLLSAQITRAAAYADLQYNVQLD